MMNSSRGGNMARALPMVSLMNEYSLAAATVSSGVGASLAMRSSSVGPTSSAFPDRGWSRDWSPPVIRRATAATSAAVVPSRAASLPIISSLRSSAPLINSALIWRSRKKTAF